MAGQKIKIDIGTSYNGQGIAKLKQGAGGASSAVGKLSKSLGNLKASMKSLGSNLMNIKAGFDMLKGAGSAFVGMFKKAFDFETMTVQFKTLTGSMDTARDHMKMLKELGDTPPFSLEAFASASRSLMVYTDGVLGLKGSLEMIGDAAAATGNPLDTVAEAVGRAYATIRDGEPVKRAATQLKNMGLITPALVAELDQLQSSGADNYEIWKKLEGALGKYKGAMAETENTGNGLMGAISSQWDNIVRNFTGALGDTTKEGLGGLLEMMRNLEKDGSIERWAQAAATAINAVAKVAATTLNTLANIPTYWDNMKSYWSDVGERVGASIGAGSNALADAFNNGEFNPLKKGLGSPLGSLKKAMNAAGQAYEDTEIQQGTQQGIVQEEKLRTESAKRVEKIRAEAERENIAETERIRGAMAGGKGHKKEKEHFYGDTLEEQNEIQEINNEVSHLKREREQANIRKLERQEQELTDELKSLKDTIKQEIDSRNRIQQGMAANNAPSGSGWNGGNRYGAYDYHPDANGNLPFQEVQRAGRMAAGAARDNASAQMGPNRQAALRQELDRLEAQEMNNAFDNANAEMNGFKGNKKMSDKDKKRMKELQDFFNQFENTDDKEQTVQNIETKLGEVKTLLEKALNAK